jgi:MraZ protein
MSKSTNLTRFVKKTMILCRFTAGVKIVVDALGRLLVPKDLVSFAKISKEIVFLSVSEYN